jgi:hypothetical protein
MRSEPAEFQGVAEALGGTVAPRVEDLSIQEMVKSAVDLHGIEVTRIVFKPSLLWQIFGIENPRPVVILVAGGSDSKHWPL